MLGSPKCGVQHFNKHGILIDPAGSDDARYSFSTPICCGQLMWLSRQIPLASCDSSGESTCSPIPASASNRDHKPRFSNSSRVVSKQSMASSIVGVPPRYCFRSRSKALTYVDGPNNRFAYVVEHWLSALRSSLITQPLGKCGNSAAIS